MAFLSSNLFKFRQLRMRDMVRKLLQAVLSTDHAQWLPKHQIEARINDKIPPVAQRARLEH